MKSALIRFCASIALSLAVSAGAQAQQKFEMKLAYFVGDQHAMSQWLVKWSEQLEKGSGGRIAVKRFPGAQMGPTPNHYDFARTGQADVSWFLHGGTPGRFPLTEIVSLPFMVGSAEAIRLSAADTVKIRSVGAEVAEATLKGHEAKGLPARAVYSSMRALSEKNAKTSKNFWN